MHARELVELAALAAVHGPVLVQGDTKIPEDDIQTYWTVSKCRLDRWGYTLKQLATKAADADPDSAPSQWPLYRGVIEEVITGEMLTRVWTAVACAYDRARGTDVAEPVARSILISHLEARHRVLTLLVGGPALSAERAVKLNRLRHRTECWTDMLIGYLLGLDDLSQLAVEPDRARQFSEDLRYRSRMPGGRFAWPLMLASLRAAFGRGLAESSPSGDLNAKIAMSVLASFPSDMFDGTGLFPSVWLRRLTHVVDDAQGMIDELVADDAPPANVNASVAERWANRSRRINEKRDDY